MLGLKESYQVRVPCEAELGFFELELDLRRVEDPTVVEVGIGDGDEFEVVHYMECSLYGRPECGTVWGRRPPDFVVVTEAVDQGTVALLCNERPASLVCSLRVCKHQAVVESSLRFPLESFARQAQSRQVPATRPLDYATTDIDRW